MSADDLLPWSNFFAAQATAAGTLAGLLFVAVSINLEHILAFPQLPGRAAEVLGMFIGILLISCLALVPNQSLLRFGLEVLAISAPLSWLTLTSAVRALRSAHRRRRWRASRVTLAGVAALSMLSAGGLLAAGRAAGLDWLVVGLTTSVALGVFNCWVLLIEIKR